MNDIFEYIVARPWHPGEPERGLCIYTYFHQIQKGSLERAKSFLEYVRTQEPGNANEYGIYEVKFIPINT